MNISEKIKAGRENKGWTQAELAAKSRVSLDSIKRYESKKNSNITIENLIKIADALGVDLNFFRSDEFVTKLLLSPVTKSQKVVTKLSLSQQNPVSQSKNSIQTLNDDIVSIPFYEDIQASAGRGAYNEAETSRVMTFGKDFLREYFGLISFKDLSIIRSIGDSMYPTLPQDCYVLVQKKAVKESEICVTRIDDELYIKRLQKQPTIRLLSDNMAYQPIDLEGKNFEIIGCIVGYFKKTAL
ncbi:LexA family transcriptional regulator [Helicobacter apodemus]|uniref:LexA family transcriptional regulator n=1 Tax=Helicobacter apodemus TaxID=135569 RepID=A0A4U8UGV6_9HELI|nr:XRE family transcriptional regulator [Helicobacter apodemus]TLE16164.1 LexA family transcriptional regulator [Helicobacter apodemus]